MPAPGSVNQLIKDLTDNYGPVIYDPGTVIELRVGASRPGTEEKNMRLSEERGRVLAEALKERGVMGQIHVVALGESLARSAFTPMAIDTGQTDADLRDTRDDANFRIAEINVRPAISAFDNEALSVPTGRNLLEDDLAAGKRIFWEIVGPGAERIRARFPVRAHPFGEDPSSDPEKFLGQVIDRGKEVVRALPNPTKAAKLLGKYTVGTLFEATVRNRWREEAAGNRRPHYRAISQGLGSGIDPEYTHGQQVDAVRQQEFNDVRDKVNRLNDTEKDQLGMYINEQYRLGHLGAVERPSYEKLPTQPSGSEIEGKAASLFETNHYYSRE